MKPICIHVCDLCGTVTPRAGVWIETSCMVMVMTGILGHPPCGGVD